VSAPATCASGGTLTFSVTNEIPAVPVQYSIYLLPDIANAVTQTTNTTVSGLAAANYYITATQTAGGSTTTAIAQSTIPDNSQLAFTVTNTTPLCGGSGSITVNVTSGVAATYQIEGSALPPQTSPNFTGITPDYHGVIVTDICGNQATEYLTIAPGGRFLVSSLARSSNFYPACNEFPTKLLLHADPARGSSPIPYPLTVLYTIHPDGGGSDIIIEQEIVSGDPWLLEVLQVLPNAVPGEILDVDVLVIHPCGTAEHTQFGSPPGQAPIFIPEIQATGNNMPAECAQRYLSVTVANLVLPYTFEFNEYPEGFDPETFNSEYPGPYTAPTIDFGSYNMPAPKGFYKATITDSCNNSRNVIYTVRAAIDAEYSSYNYDCVNNLGGINALLVPTEGDFEVNLTTAIITGAPEDYEPSLPHDVSEFISSAHELALSGLPAGTYALKFADECDNTVTKSILVRQFVPSIMLGDTRPDCDPGLGTVTISTHNEPLTGVRITRAPADFPYPIPYDVSFNITDGVFYMDGIPAGSYAFLGVDACYNPDKPRYYSVIVSGYEVTANNLEIIPGCNTYDIVFNYQSNAADEKFWLQKQLPNGSWGHPVTDEPYNEGTAPTQQNAIQLDNSQTLTTGNWSGTFRILKYHQAYSPVTTLKDCIEELHTFDLHQGLQLLETNVLSCPDSPIDLELVTNGAAPTIYTITHRNGIPYLIQNGENNIFRGLDVATYTVNITDSCGRDLTVDITTEDATPLIVVNDPGTLFTCDTANDGQDTFTLSMQDAGILGSQLPSEYTVTYHATQADADTGAAVLPNLYITQPTTIYARVTRNDTPGCFKTIAFTLQLYAVPELNMTTPVAFCAGQSVTITAPAGFVTYRWSNGVGTAENTIRTEGDYIITVTNANGCSTSQTITVITSPVPEIENIEIIDFTTNNTITVNIKQTETPIFPEYSLDGITFQESNIFENLESGNYTVYVRDQFRCGFDSKAVYLLMYPKYFSPNGDGTNETWHIKFSYAAEPDMMVYIYDRFGRLITGFNGRSEGWDGTFNGAPLPGSDYWFVVKRQNGKEYRGHFSLIR